jgi:DNA-binding transcriptional LysR family regulator
MRHFEARLGVRLLNRTTRKVPLTEAGERPLPALADLSQAVDKLNDLRSDPRGVLRSMAPQQPAELLQFPCIERRFPNGRRYRWEFWQDGRKQEVAVKGSLVLDNNERILQAARAGVGIAFLHEGTVREDLIRGELVEILADFTQLEEGFWLYYPSRKYLSAPLRHFIDWLKEINIYLKKPITHSI